MAKLEPLSELYGKQLDDVLDAWQDTRLCKNLARCPTSVDGHCIGGTKDGHCLD